jgi:hypothetical protein
MGKYKVLDDYNSKVYRDPVVKTPYGDSPHYKMLHDKRAPYEGAEGYNVTGGDPYAPYGLQSTVPAASPFILSNPHQFTGATGPAGASGPALSAEDEKARAIEYYDQLIDLTELEIKNLHNLSNYYSQQKQSLEKASGR